MAVKWVMASGYKRPPIHWEPFLEAGTHRVYESDVLSWDTDKDYTEAEHRDDGSIVLRKRYQRLKRV